MAGLKRKQRIAEFPEVIPVTEAIQKGDIFTKLTCLIMGAGNFARKQIIQGLLFLAAEIGYICFMVFYGVGALHDFMTLGTETQSKVFNEAKQIYEYTTGDNSQLCLLYGVVTIFVTIGFILLWRAAIRSSYIGQLAVSKGNTPITFGQILKELKDRRMHHLLMSFPLLGIVMFTVMPLIFMILMAFTNYDRDHLPPGKLFDWVGLENFGRVLNAGGTLGITFWKVLGWTLIWAFFATFLNYIFGIILALIINRDGTKCKSMWRFLFTLTIAVPQFVSLLVMNTMLQEHGVFNLMAKELFNAGPFPFLSNATWARVTVIIINLWVGIPYTLISVTGILKNIPAELYEAAKVDGANAFVTFFKITMPYMMFVMTPQLIVTFTQNINNFNVIFLLTNGAPATDEYYRGTAGKTDLLVTWLYKLTIDNKDYNLGAVIGILTFILMATLSLLTYRNTGSYKDEEGFS
ncbi:MAG: sugar ABC transporter permease [Lachnospiraceae bacterium]|nr:sugar ABC transporter permease [Lachnospiraceae bacterium]